MITSKNRHKLCCSLFVSLISFVDVDNSIFCYRYLLLPVIGTCFLSYQCPQWHLICPTVGIFFWQFFVQAFISIPPPPEFFNCVWLPARWLRSQDRYAGCLPSACWPQRAKGISRVVSIASYFNNCSDDNSSVLPLKYREHMIVMLCLVCDSVIMPCGWKKKVYFEFNYLILNPYIGI